jgi:hypothetical protein
LLQQAQQLVQHCHDHVQQQRCYCWLPCCCCSRQLYAWSLLGYVVELQAGCFLLGMSCLHHQAVQALVLLLACLSRPAEQLHLTELLAQLLPWLVLLCDAEIACVHCLCPLCCSANLLA